MIMATRASGGDGNPFEQLADRQATQKAVTITDENTAVVELTLSP
jgi:hypothetical protein